MAGYQRSALFQLHRPARQDSQPGLPRLGPLKKDAISGKVIRVLATGPRLKR
jgi:hypothetical protein